MNVLNSLMAWVTLPSHSVNISAFQETETRCRIRWIHGKLRFEYMFVSPVRLIHNSPGEYDDPCGKHQLFVQYSTDSENWENYQFTDAQTPEIQRPDGSWEYWSISRHPLSGRNKKPNQYARLGAHLFRHRLHWI